LGGRIWEERTKEAVSLRETRAMYGGGGHGGGHIAHTVKRVEKKMKILILLKW